MCRSGRDSRPFRQQTARTPASRRLQNLRRKTKLFFFLFRKVRVVSPSLCVLDSLGEQQPGPDLTTHLALGPPDNDMVSLLKNARCACG